MWLKQRINIFEGIFTALDFMFTQDSKFFNDYKVSVIQKPIYGNYKCVLTRVKTAKQNEKLWSKK